VSDVGGPAPTVTVVVPTRDRGHEVTGAVGSALDGQGVDLEVVVVDDGSTDDTTARLGRLGDPRLRVLRQDPAGAAAARNTGVRSARGTWIALLDSDDRLRPGGLDRLVAATGPDVDVVSGAARFVDPDGTAEVVAPRALGAEFGGVAGLFLAGTVLVRRDAWEAVGGQLPGLAYSENTELALRLCDAAARRGRRVVAVADPVVDVARRDVVRHDDLARAAAARRVAEHDRHLLARAPAALASYWALAGVHLARAGRTGPSLGALARAWRAHPTDLRHPARLIVVALPPLRRRRYPPRVVGRSGT
jgi:glycosyltransferase involved in cell wall biosynthesis